MGISARGTEKLCSFDGRTMRRLLFCPGLFLIIVALFTSWSSTAKSQNYGDPGAKYVFGADSPLTVTQDVQQQHPDISGNIAVWDDARPGGGSGNPIRIFYKDLTRNDPEQPLVQTPGTGASIDGESDAVISGNLVAWLVDSTSGVNSIHYMFLGNGCPGASGCEQVLATPGAKPGLLAISGHRIVWQDHRISDTQNDIYIFDLDNPALGPQLLINWPGDDIEPAISGDWLVWIHNDNYINFLDPQVNDVYAVNLVTGQQGQITIGQQRQITTDGGSQVQELPSIDGNQIVWDVATNGGGIWLYNIDTYKTLQIFSSVAEDTRPEILGDKIVWEHTTAITHPEIWLCDLATGNSEQVSEDTGADQYYPAISADGHILWQDGRLGVRAIFENKIGDTAQTLADKYSPILILHHEEAFEPKPVEMALNMPGTYLRKWNSQLSGWDPNFNPIANPSPSTLQANPTSDIFIDLPGSAPDTSSYIAGYNDFKFMTNYLSSYYSIENNYPDTIYSHLVRNANGQISIQFWFFYYVNNFWNFHEGDWETVDVFLDSNLTPKACAYSTHDDGSWREWGQVEGSSSHPIVYVANGSHANYFNSGAPGTGAHVVKLLRDYGVADYTDNLNGKFLAIHNIDVLPDSPFSNNDNVYGWLAFQGNWGEINRKIWIDGRNDRDGPPGPASQGSKWSDPFTWLSNLPCDGCQDGTGIQTDLEITRHSPIDIRVYDSQGRVMAKTLGPTDVPIPGAEYLDYPELDRASIIIHGGNINDGYRIEADGNATGNAGLTITAPDHAGGSVDTLNYNGMAVNNQTKITLNLDNVKNYIANIDEYGNGTDVTQKAPDTQVTNTVDFTPPATVTNLAVSSTDSGSASLSFTAPGDDGNTGTATSYDVRYATSPITDQNWKDATPAANLPAPLAGGSSQSIMVSGLSEDTTYYFALKAMDEAGLISGLSNNASGATKRDYYWPWYDYQSAGTYDWLFLGDPKDASSPLTFSLWIGGNLKTLPGNPPGQISPGQVQVASFSGTIGGPVKITSATGDKGILSRRTLLASGPLEDLPAVDKERLSGHYFWPWYDSTGTTNDWVMLANPSTSSIYYEVKLSGQLKSSGTLNAGATVSPKFSGTSGGLLEAEAWTDSGKTTPANIIASQRVTTNSGGAFNELMGIPSGELSDRYLWTWYDPAHGGDWIMVSNPSASDIAQVKISIGTSNYGPYNISPGQTAIESYNTSATGPVSLTATKTVNGVTTPINVIATQRVLFGPSFEEVPGIPASLTGGVNLLGSDYHWGWYDQQSSGSYNWVMIANPDIQPVHYEIYIAGSLKEQDKYGGTTNTPIPAGAYVAASFPGIIGGPVEVKSCSVQFDTYGNCPDTNPPAVIASQRQLWNGYFNEVWGQETH